MSAIAPSTFASATVSPCSTSTIRVVIRSRGPLRWKLPVTTSGTASAEAISAGPPLVDRWREACTTRQRSTTRNRSSTARSLVTVSAIPADSHATSGSPVTFP